MEQQAPSHVAPVFRGAMVNALAGKADELDELLPNYEKLTSSAFPYTRNASKTVAVGGSRLGANFSASLLVGTNFDCAHETFNYEAGVFANATLTLFDCTQTAVEAFASYGVVAFTRLCSTSCYQSHAAFDVVA